MVNDFITANGKRLKLESGDIVSRQYRVVRQLRKDDFGVAYEVVTKHTGDTLQLIFLPSLIAQNAAALGRLKEKILACSVLSEDHLLGVFSSGEHEGHPYYVAGYFTSLELSNMVATNGKLTPREVIRLLLQIGPALASSHSQNFVHGDIRPSHFWYNHDGAKLDVKLGGLSVANELRDSLARVTGVDLPDANIYRAPECLLGKPPDAASDQYSLAACCYEFLSGVPPFVPPGLSDKILEQEAADISGMPPDVNATINKALAKNPGERFGDCAAFAAALLQSLNEIAEPVDEDISLAAILPSQEGAPVELRARPKKNRKLLLLAMLPLLLLILLLLDMRFGLIGFAQAISGNTKQYAPKVTKTPTKKPTVKPTPSEKPSLTPSPTPTPAPTLKAEPPADLRLEGSPQEATIRLLSGLPDGETRKNLAFGTTVEKLLPGRYILFAEAEGFLEASRVIDLKAGAKVTTHIALEPVPKVSVAPTKKTTAVASTKPIATPKPTPTRAPLPLMVERLHGPRELKGIVTRPKRPSKRATKKPTFAAEKLPKPTKKPSLIIESTLEVESARGSAKTTEIYRIRTTDKQKKPEKKETPYTAPIGSTVSWGRRAFSLFERNYKKPVITRNSRQMRLAWIPPGAFFRGSPAGEAGRTGYEGPQMRIRFKRGFWLGAYEVTRRQFAFLMGTRYGKGPNLPMTSITWHEAQEFCDILTQKERKAGILPKDVRYTLPTETMWEYACRAGTSDSRYANKVEAIAWFSGNSKAGLKVVGRRRPNKWGLYDMLGNAREWCSDIWLTRYAPDPSNAPEPRTLPFTFDAPMGRVWRGGSAIDHAPTCRAAFRRWGDPDKRSPFLGFRVAFVKGEIYSMYTQGQLKADARSKSKGK